MIAHLRIACFSAHCKIAAEDPDEKIRAAAQRFIDGVQEEKQEREAESQPPAAP